MIVLEGRNLTLSYTTRPVIERASLAVRQGEILSLIGPNGSGKSTLLKALCRLMKPESGEVRLFGEDIWKIPTKEVAGKVAIVPQVKHVPAEVTVRDLVGFGRFPHMKFAHSMSREDEMRVEEAIATTKLEKQADRLVATLSGGERQRAWIAMALAQTPQILILDEPTTFLDISHQLEIMETICKLNRESHMTIIMVLHDINQAVRFSDTICAIKSGEIVAVEKAKELMTKERIQALFGVEGAVFEDPEHACPFFIPHRSIDKISKMTNRRQL